jgi:hypothetical protein
MTLRRALRNSRISTLSLYILKKAMLLLLCVSPLRLASVHGTASRPNGMVGQLYKNDS